MSQGRVGYKSKIAWGDGGTPEVFTEVAEQTDCEPPEEVAEEVEFSNQDSPGRRREFKPGWIDSGSLTFTCNYVVGNLTQSQLRDDANTGIIRNWRLSIREPYTGATDETATFAAYVTSSKLGTISPMEPMKLTTVLRVTGPTTWA